MTAEEPSERRRWAASPKVPPRTAEEPSERRRWAASPKVPPRTAAEPGERRRWPPTPRKRDAASTSIERRRRAAPRMSPAITTADQTGCPQLEGWPTVSLDTLDVRVATLEEFREVIRGRVGAVAYAVETAPGGSALARVLDCEQYSESRDIAGAYLGSPPAPFTWRAEHLILLNEPCYLVVGTGVVFLGDGRIVRETVFSAEEPFDAGKTQTVAYRIGGGLSSVSQLPFMLRAAPTLDDRIWAPLLSRWSMVYGHMISESLVEDSVLHRTGFSPLISFAATGYPEGAQHIAMTQAHAPVESFPHPIVKVPRLIFASKLYRHFPLGAELRNAIRDVKARISLQADPRMPAHEKIYVSRLGIVNRPMINEADLIARLSSMGFYIVAPQSMSFEEQVLTFRGARLIVGPYGSGLVNSVFAAPDAALCELRPLHTALDSPLWDTYYYCLASTMGFSYGTHISTNPPNTDTWQCDIPQVLELIRAASAAIDGA
jgi:capsular polysaccharide biosynthesis protein